MSDSWNGSAWVLEICATTDGVHWSGPTNVGDGTSPSAAIGPNGRAVLVWANEIASTGAQSVQGSILPPGGSWSSPAILNDTPGDPSIVMDSSGNALAMWATPGSDDDSAVQTSTLAANSTRWTAPVTLASAGGLGRLVGNAAGDVLITFRTRTTNDIQAVSGTILGGLGAPVTLGITNGYVELASNRYPRSTAPARRSLAGYRLTTAPSTPHGPRRERGVALRRSRTPRRQSISRLTAPVTSS